MIEGWAVGQSIGKTTVAADAVDPAEPPEQPRKGKSKTAPPKDPFASDASAVAINGNVLKNYYVFSGDYEK